MKTIVVRTIEIKAFIIYICESRAERKISKSPSSVCLYNERLYSKHSKIVFELFKNVWTVYLYSYESMNLKRFRKHSRFFDENQVDKISKLNRLQLLKSIETFEHAIKTYIDATLMPISHNRAELNFIARQMHARSLPLMTFQHCMMSCGALGECCDSIRFTTT